MDPVIDRKIKVPLHYQIYLDLLKRIQSGFLRPGEGVLLEPELEQIYGISRMTARDAIEILDQGGLAEKNRGKKETVIYKTKHVYDMKRLISLTDDVHLYGERVSFRFLDSQELVPEKRITQLLELEEGEPVLHIEQKRCRQDVTVGLHKSYIKMVSGLRPREEEFRPDVSLYVILRANGIVPTTTSEVLETKTPLDRTLEVLGLKPQTVVFYKERMTYSGDRNPFEYVRMFYSPDYYQYRVKLRLD